MNVKLEQKRGDANVLIADANDKQKQEMREVGRGGVAPNDEAYKTLRQKI